MRVVRRICEYHVPVRGNEYPIHPCGNRSRLNSTACKQLPTGVCYIHLCYKLTKYVYQPWIVYFKGHPGIKPIKATRTSTLSPKALRCSSVGTHTDVITVKGEYKNSERCKIKKYFWLKRELCFPRLLISNEASTQLWICIFKIIPAPEKGLCHIFMFDISFIMTAKVTFPLARGDSCKWWSGTPCV